MRVLYTIYFKRTLDFIAALLGLVIVSPICLILALLLYIFQDGKVLFKQKRPGKEEKIFTLIKFRTLSDARDSNNELLPDAKRLTFLGKIIRSTSLDELPQLINVLKGEMSLVGPRPLLMEYLPLYNAEQKMRHNVRPGITGWAQVNGRNQLSWQEKFKMDIWYVKNLGFLLDLNIIFVTIYNVLAAKGIKGKNSATMSKFKGN